jgi:hypothetical protein
MFCPRCGSNQGDQAAACAACGMNLSPGGISQAPLVVAPEQAIVPPVQVVIPPQGAPFAGAARPTNPLSIAGFVCGLFGLTPFWVGFLLCILAIVFSAIAMSKASRLGGIGRGFAIAGLVMGIVFLMPAACGI